MIAPKFTKFGTHPVRVLLITASLLAVADVTPLMAQGAELLGTARTILLKSDVIYNKDRRANSTPIPYPRIYRAGILKFFREVESNPDIIVKFHKDVFLLENETISITVFNAEDNTVLYTEERKLVDEDNDVDRLVAHFLAKVKADRDSISEVAAQTKRLEASVEQNEKETAAQKAWDERDKAAANNAKQVLSFYSPSASLTESLVEANRKYPEKCKVYLSAAGYALAADVVIEESLTKGMYTLILKSRETGEVFHQVAVPQSLSKKAITSLEAWINSTEWK